MSFITEGIKMTETGEVYRCGICGMVVEVKEAGSGVLVCCGQDMQKLDGTKDK